MLRKGVVFVITFQVIAAVNHCQTPNGENGDCIIINKCSSLYQLIRQRPISSKTTVFLKQSTCGFSGVIPHVCCSLSTTKVATEGPTETPLVNEPRAALNNLLPSFDTCGISTAPRIYGGQITSIDEFPWMALLEYEKANQGKRYLCGGVLISKRYILTAAHCVHQGSLKSVNLTLKSVRLGEYNQDTNPDCVNNDDCADPHKDIPIEEQIIHEGYTTDLNHYNDIALLRLKSDVNFTDFIKPICLPSRLEDKSMTYNGEKLYVSGWGDTEERNTTYSNVKLKVKLPIKDFSSCKTSYFRVLGGKIVLSSNQICAGGEKGKDSCKGDSGGPLMRFSTNTNGDVNWVSVGIVSFGPTLCGNSNMPGVYTKVANYVPWIMSKLRP